MAAERVMGTLIEVVKEAVLAAVREELAAHKEEVNELRHMLTAVQGDLAEQKQSNKLQLEEAEQKRVTEIREMKGQVEERERELAEQINARIKLDVDEQISQSEGDQKTAWERIKLASKGTDLSLANLHGLSDDMLAHVSTMTHLERIDCTSTSGFSAEGIKHLYRLPQLQELDLECTDVSDNALEGIGALTSLKHLDLQRTNVTDAGLPHLTGLSSLKLLWLTQCSVTDAGMVHVGRLTGLEELALDGTAVTDDGLQQLTALTQMTAFWPPEGERLTDDAVRRRMDW